MMMEAARGLRGPRLRLAEAYVSGVGAMAVAAVLTLLLKWIGGMDVFNLAHPASGMLFAVLSLALVLCGRRIDRRSFVVVLPLFLYCCWCVVTVLWSIWPGRTLPYAFAAMCFFGALICLPVVLAGSGRMRLGRDEMRLILLCLIALLLCMIVLGAVYDNVVSYLLRDRFYSRLRGLGMTANTFGSYCFALIICAHILHCINKGMFSKCLIAVGCILIVLTMSRGLILGLGVYFLLYFFFSRQQGNIVFLLAIVLPVIILFISARDAGNYVPPQMKPYLGSPRLFIWGNALSHNVKNGFLWQGTGYESGHELTRRTDVGDYFTGVRISKGDWEPDTDRRAGVSLHGALAKIFFTTGIVGFALFAWAMAVLALTLARSSGPLAPCGLPCLVSLLTADVTSSYFWAGIGPLPSIALFATLGMLLVDAVSNPRRTSA